MMSEKRFLRLPLACLSAMLPVLAWAQVPMQQQAPAQQAAPAAPRAQPAPPTAAPDPGQFLQGANQVLQMLDQRRAGEVWDGGSAVLKRAAAREAFIAQVGAAQTRLGNPVRRGWTSISRQAAGAGDKLPQGQYASVGFLTAFAKGNAREIVSFRLDEDGRWRVTGYVVN